MTMINKHFSLHTKNLQLRMFKVRDARAVQEFLSLNKQYMLPWIPWAVNEPESIEEKKRKIREWKDGFKQNTKFVYGIYEKGREELIGMSFMFTRRGKGTLEIGYILDFRQYGKGYATEASKVLTDLGFELGVEKMLIYCDETNLASSRVPEKLGYELVRLETEESEDGNKRLMIWELKNPELN